MGVRAKGESDEKLPARSDVVIVGGADHRRQRGAVSGQEGRFGDAVRKGPDRWRAIEPELGLVPHDGARARRTAAQHREPAHLARSQSARSGAETGFRQCGIAYVYDTPREIDASEAWLESARSYQLGARRLNEDEIDTLLPGSARKWRERAVYRQRRARGTGARRSGNRRGRCSAGANVLDAMRRSGRGDLGGARKRRDHREGPHRLPKRRARRRRLVATVLWQFRRGFSAIENTGLRHAHGAA